MKYFRKKRLGTHLKRLALLNVNYRVPTDLLIERDEGFINIYSAQKNGVIHYTIDGSTPDNNSPVYKKPIRTKGIYVLQARLITESGKAGTYDISGTFSCTDPAEMKLAVDNKEIPFKIRKPKGWYEPVKVDIGKVVISADAGTHKVVLSVANANGYTGINMWGIDFIEQK